MKDTYRLIYPPDYDAAGEKTWGNYDFIHSLQIDDMVVIPQVNYRGGKDLSLEKFFSSDPRVLEYRLGIVEDLTEHRDLYQVFCDAVSLIYHINDLKKVLNPDFSVDSALGSVRYLELYQEIVELFAGAFEKYEVHSEGLLAFRERIREIVKGEEF